MIFTDTDIQYIKKNLLQYSVTDDSFSSVTNMRGSDKIPIVHYENADNGTESTNKTITKQDFFKHNDGVTEVNFSKATVSMQSLKVYNSDGTYKIYTDNSNSLFTCIFNNFSFISDYNKDGGSVGLSLGDKGNCTMTFSGRLRDGDVLKISTTDDYHIQVYDTFNNRDVTLGISVAGINRTFRGMSSDYTKIMTSIFYNTAGRATYFQSLNTDAITSLISSTRAGSSSDESYTSNIMTYTQLVQDNLPTIPTDFIKGDTKDVYVSLVNLVEYTTQLKQYIKEQIEAAVNKL